MWKLPEAAVDEICLFFLPSAEAEAAVCLFFYSALTLKFKQNFLHEQSLQLFLCFSADWNGSELFSKMGQQNMKIKELVWSKELTDKSPIFSGEVSLRKKYILPTAMQKRNDNIDTKVNFATEGKLLHLG